MAHWNDNVFPYFFLRRIHPRVHMILVPKLGGSPRTYLNKIKTFGVRPESISMVSVDKGEIEAIVETIQPTGADWIVGLIVSGKSFFAISSEQPKANVGQKVGLSFKLEGLHGFDDKDQRIKCV